MNAIFTGQGVTTGSGDAWVQLSETGPLSTGVFVMSSVSANTVVSATGAGTPASDGTGSGIILGPDTPPLFLPVSDASQVYIGNIGNLIYSWYAY